MADGEYDGDGLHSSWDDPSPALPDLTGLEVSHLDAAAGGGDASRAAPVGSGARFAKLKGELAAKGAADPGALAAWIGRKKFGRAKFAGLAAAARKSGGTAQRWDGGAFREIRRDCQLEDIHILRTGEGDSSGRCVEAYAAVFDQPAEIVDHQGHYEETIDRGAFDDRIAQIQRSRRGLASALRVLYNHGRTAEGHPAPEFQKPLGRPVEVRAESRGLLTRTEYAKTPHAEEVLELIRAGAITAQSFVGGIIRSSPELHGPGDKYRARNGVLPRVRRMTLGLREYGPVLWEAYSGAEILGVRMQLPGGAVTDFDSPVDDEYDSANEEPVAGGAPEEAHASRYHQHALWALQLREILEKKGLTL